MTTLLLLTFIHSDYEYMFPIGKEKMMTSYKDNNNHQLPIPSKSSSCSQDGNTNSTSSSPLPSETSNDQSTLMQETKQSSIEGVTLHKNIHEENPYPSPDIKTVRMKQQEQVRQSAIKAKQKKRMKEMERLKRTYFPLPSSQKKQETGSHGYTSNDDVKVKEVKPIHDWHQKSKKDHESSFQSSHQKPLNQQSLQHEETDGVKTGCNHYKKDDNTKSSSSSHINHHTTAIDMHAARMHQQEKVNESARKAKEKKHSRELERLQRSYFPLP